MRTLRSWSRTRSTTKPARSTANHGVLGRGFLFRGLLGLFGRLERFPDERFGEHETRLGEVALYAEFAFEGAVILDGRTPHGLLLELFTRHGAGTLISA